MLLIPRRHVLREAEICQLQLGVLRGAEQDVLWLEVQVGDIVVVEELQGAGELLQEDTCHLLGQDPPHTDEAGEVPTGTELHDQVDVVTVPLEVLELHDVRVTDGLEDLDLSEQVLHRGPVEAPLAHTLDSHHLARVPLAVRFVHRGVGAGAEALGEHEAVEARWGAAPPGHAVPPPGSGSGTDSVRSSAPAGRGGFRCLRCFPAG